MVRLRNLSGLLVRSIRGAMATEEKLPDSLSGYSPSNKEKELFQFLFDKADSDKLGVLTGDKAVPFFAFSSLNPATLGEIWQLADPENSGFLTPTRFGVACRLIGHAQLHKNEPLNEQWIAQQGPAPKFQGISPPAHLTQFDQPPSAAPNRQSTLPTTAANGSNNTISAADRAKYARLFANAGPVNGLLDGDKARDIFIKSGLPFETLSKIWSLSDTHSRGALDVADFCVGMHLIQGSMNGTMPALPTVLSPQLYASALGTSIPSTANAGIASASPSPAKQPPPVPPSRHVSHSSAHRPFPAPTAFPPQAVPSSPFGPASFSQQAQTWDVTAAEKQESDQYFDTLDTARKGTIEGEQAVGFFSQSGLPVDLLAKVWDLSDIGGKGSLDKDEFAVALKMIRDKLSGKEVPDVLPLSLVPPSKRAGGFGPVVPMQQQQPTGPQRDLLDLMGDEDAASTPAAQPAPTSSMPPLAPTSPTQRAMSPQITGQPRTLSPQTTGTSAINQQHPVSPQQTGSRSSFNVGSQQTSSFVPQRASLSPQATGTSTPVLGGTIFPQLTGSTPTGNRAMSPAAAPSGTTTTSGFANNFVPLAAPVALAATGAAAAKTSSNFFDDNDLEDKSQELATHQTQLKSLEAEHEQASSTAKDATARRTEVEQSLSSVQAEIESLKSKLSSAKTTFETEQKALDDLKARKSTLVAEQDKTRQELITAESELSRVKLEKGEVESDILGAKEEIRDIKRKVADVAKETAALKDELEKLKKEQRHQKGLLAISKKQLNTAESENAAVKKELAELSAVAAVEPSLTSHHVSDAVPLSEPVALAKEVPLPTSPPAVTSPAGSVRSTNPFERMGFGGSTPHLAPTTPDAVPAASSSSAGPGLVKAAALGAGAAGLATAGAAGVSHFAHHDDHAVTESTSSAPTETDPFGVPSSAAASTSGTKTFDEAFGDDFGSAEPAAAAAALPVADTPVVETDKTTVPGGFDDAFADFDKDPAEHTQPSTTDQTDESSDDEPEIEDAVPSRRAAGSPSAAPSTTIAGTSAGVFAASSGAAAAASENSDSSYVHVAPADSAESREIEEKFPNIDALPEERQDDTTTETEPTSGSEQHFEDATATQANFGTAVLPSLTEGASQASGTTTHRRAAPPPPTRHQPSASVQSQDAFADSFAEQPHHAVDEPAKQPDADDFESSFADMGDAGASKASAATGGDFEHFDDDFDFKPDFEDEAGNSSAAPVTANKDGFDDAFENFDSSFDSRAPASNPAQTAAGFDDAFGSPNQTETAQPGDVDGVKQIIGMGFSRQQAITALEKYDYDVTRAVNSLL